ncbi:MAG: radical SAM protein [Victivallaceae bacterium]|nr:radical SAM protein [Victivallaceae bacterium]
MSGRPVPINAPLRFKIYFTWGCNLKCPFCYQKDLRGLTAARPIEDFLKLLDELAELGVFEITFSGGEPFSHPRFFDLIDRAVASRMRFSILTNATLIDDEIARRLAATGRCNHVQTSIDGLEQYHDSVRGPGAFRRTMNAIESLHKAGVKTYVNTVMTRNNYRDFIAICRMLEATPASTYRIVSVRDADVDLPDDMIMTSEQLVDSIAELAPVMSELGKMHRTSLQKQLLLEIMGEGPLHAAEHCRTPWTTLAVRPDGGFFSCDETDDALLGWMGCDRVSDIWKSARLARFRSSLCERLALEPDECGDCRYRELCMRYCPLWNHSRFCRLVIEKGLRQRGVIR